jgi:hypothetical protein
MSTSDRIAKFFNEFTASFKGRTAKFERNGHVHYARFGKSKSDIGKFAYEGNDSSSKSSETGYKAKIRLLADGNMFEIVEDANYFDTEAERGKKKKTHKNAKHWDYYIKTIIVDGKGYDVLINVRNDVLQSDYSTKEEYVYSIRFRDNKNVTTSLVRHATSKATSKLDAATNNSIPQKSYLSTLSEKKYSLAPKESQTSAKEAVFGKSDESEKIPSSRVVQSTVKYSIAKAGELAENTTKYNDKHGAVEPSALKRGVNTMKRMAALMQLYLDKPGVLPPDVIGKTAWKNGSYGRTMKNTTLCIRTLTYEYFKDEVAKAIGRPLTVSESLLASQKIYDIASYCILPIKSSASSRLLNMTISLPILYLSSKASTFGLCSILYFFITSINSASSSVSTQGISSRGLPRLSRIPLRHTSRGKSRKNTVSHFDIRISIVEP